MNLNSEETKWLKSPLTDKVNRLQALNDVMIHPYYGQKRKLKLIRTHYSIGSDPHCDIKLDDPFVSPKHAELVIYNEGAGYFIKDLQSRNGIFLNGVRVREAPLFSTGILRMGRSTFSWSDSNNEEDVGIHDWIVADPFMKEMLKKLKVIAKSSISILLLGETGTGKEVLAKLLHQWSKRESGPYVALNASLMGGGLADSELFGHLKGAFTGSENNRMGAMRNANGGTLFLDEIADLPLSTQVKLLRTLETGEVKALGSDQVQFSDFRIISATSQDVESKIQSKEFRLDLYYRIAGYVVQIPPLRDRPKDIIAISKKLASDRGFELDEESMSKFLSYSWPGNVRELKSNLERAMVIAQSEKSSRILPHHIAGFEKGIQPVLEKMKQKITLEDMEKEFIKYSLERNGWSRTVAAKELGIARSTLFEKMRKFGIRDEAVIQQ